MQDNRVSSECGLLYHQLIVRRVEYIVHLQVVTLPVHIKHFSQLLRRAVK